MNANIFFAIYFTIALVAAVAQLVYLNLSERAYRRNADRERIEDLERDLKFYKECAELLQSMLDTEKSISRIDARLQAIWATKTVDTSTTTTEKKRKARRKQMQRAHQMMSSHHVEAHFTVIDDDYLPF